MSGCQNVSHVAAQTHANETTGKLSQVPSQCLNCGSDQRALRKRTLSNASIQFVFQCLRCGRAVTSAIARSRLNPSDVVSDWDELLYEAYQRERREALQEQREQERSEWFQRHDNYLQSSEWREKRRKVLRRARGLCEGCGNRQPTQVHHLSYAHWGNELLWELVAVCDDCHDRAHDRGSLGG